MQPEENEDYLRINKRHWDAAAVRNWPRKKGEYARILSDPDHYLEDVEPWIYTYIREIQGKRVIVLQFGDGYVMIACALKGAKVTGVDLSREHVRLAGRAATMCSVEIDLVEADCQNLPEAIQSSYFDLAVAECGIFIWIADLEAWMAGALRVLKRGGKLVVQDFHPISHVAEDFRVKLGDGTVALRRSYLDQTPEIYRQSDDLPPAIEFTWKISDVVNAAIDVGFEIVRLEEFYDIPGEEQNLIPNKYLLVATKK